VSDIPRRVRLDRMSAGELAIHDAKGVVEGMGSDVRLTDAIMLLSAAQNKVADFVDRVPQLVSAEDCYVAFCRYTKRTIVTCDSDAPGAFKVYRWRDIAGVKR
jgi:hypothetical protein